MDSLKIKADQLFDGHRFRSDEVLVLRQDGTVEDIIPASEAADDVQQLDGLVCPGFINCHCHLELSHLKNKITEGAGLVQFVREVVIKRNVNEDEILNSIQDAEDEMSSNGIMAVGDICNTTDTIEQKKKARLHYHNFIEVLGSDPVKAKSNFERFNDIYKYFTEALPAAQVSFAPHAPYSVSEPLWEKILRHEQKLMTIHSQETADEDLWFQNKTGAFTALFEGLKINTCAFTATGKSSLQSYLQKFPGGQPLILVHNVSTKEEDMYFAVQQPLNLFWCFCPSANQYISGQVPDVPMFMNSNCTIVLGTDSLASNHQLSIWEEIKTIQKHFPHIDLEQMLQWATLNGAKALKIDGSFGSFEKGKKPGVVHISHAGKIQSF